MNDPLIVYKYNSKKKININKYKDFIKKFSNCKRGNYNGMMWDSIIENNIIKKYILFSKNNYNQFILFLNNFIKSNYTNTIIEKPKIIYVPVNTPNDNINEQLELITKKTKLINSLIKK